MNQDTLIKVRPVYPPSDAPAVRRLFYSGVLEDDHLPDDSAKDIEYLVDAYLSDEGASHFWVAHIECNDDANDDMIDSKYVNNRSSVIIDDSRNRLYENYDHDNQNGNGNINGKGNGLTKNKKPGSSRIIRARVPGTSSGDMKSNIVGMIGAKRMNAEAIEIRRLRVDPSHRQQGVGRRLIETALDFCHEQGYLKVRLDTHVEQFPAISLFEQFGFRLNRTREINGKFVHDFYLDLYRRYDPSFHHPSG